MTEAQSDEGRMTLVEHLTELRRRVIVSAFGRFIKPLTSIVTGASGRIEPVTVTCLGYDRRLS